MCCCSIPTSFRGHNRQTHSDTFPGTCLIHHYRLTVTKVITNADGEKANIIIISFFLLACLTAAMDGQWAVDSFSLIGQK